MALSTQRDSAFLPSPHQSAPQPNHDVFLSFRGEDTRLSFVSHLYHELQHKGIKTFKDDPKLERGTAISSGLFNAVQESRLAIVVLSPKYASSTWCLDELTEIQCMKSKGTILPVFYNVDPSHVRKQSGSFADAFAEHEKRFREDIDKVKRWRDALTKVANLYGIDSNDQTTTIYINSWIVPSSHIISIPQSSKVKMAASNLFLLTILALSTTMPLFIATTSAHSLNYNLIGSNTNLEVRLNLDEESSNCWDSLFQLRACSGEVFMFLMNGETYLGHGCCEAIRTIEHQCWPALLGTLGFTIEETDVLKAYCDEAHHIQFPPSTPSPPAVDKPIN